MFENRVLRMIFGPKRNKIKGKWKKPFNEELNGLYSSPDIRMIKSRRMRWAGYVAHMERSGAYRGLVGKPEGKRPLGRPRRRWENIRADSHYASRFRSVAAPSSFLQIGLCSHCPSCSVTFRRER
jgi:hypothetical protein